MRNVKRILCSVIAFAMLMSCMVFGVSAASFPDVPDGHANKLAIDQLSDLGIIQGDDQGNFNPDNNVNRAEFTALVMRFIGQSGTLGTISVENAPFPDLSDSAVSWAIGDITIARNLGIINGYEDGTFRPTNPVAYEEAVKMIVCALGYGKAIVPATDAALWYQPYMTIATEMGFTQKAGGTVEVPATRGMIAQMLYDAKDVKTLDSTGKVSDKSVLQDKLGSTKVTGIIISNDKTSLSSPDTRTRDNEIEILTREDGKEKVYTYTISNNSYKNWIGYQVDLYYTEERSDNNRILTSASKKNTKEITVEAKDIIREDSTESSIKYYPDSKSNAKSLSISSENVVIYNDKLYGNTADSSKFDADMLPVVGKVTLLDVKGSGSYDVIKIDSYEVFFASAVTTSDYTVSDRICGDPRDVKLNVNDSSAELKITDTSGKETTFSSIRKNSVVSFKESNKNNGGELLQTAVVNNTTKSGEVMGINSSEIKLAGTTYNISQAAPWLLYSDKANALKAPNVGDNITVYFDLNGDVVAYEKSAVVSNQQYGYITGANTASALDNDSLKIMMMYGNNKKEYFYTYKGTKLAGKTYSTADEFESALREYVSNQNTDKNSGVDLHQLVKFSTKTVNRETKLDEIVPVTLADNGQAVENDVLARFSKVSGAMAMKYTSSNKQLKCIEPSDGPSISLADSTKIFVVPHDRTQTSKYRIPSSITTDFKNNGTYYVEAFDVSTSRTPKAVVLYGVDASTEVNVETPVYVIKEIDVTDEDTPEGGQMARLTVYQAKISGSVTTTTVWLSPESELDEKDLKIGDVIRCATDEDGYATVAPKDVLWCIDDLGVVSNTPVTDDTNGKTDYQETEFTVINSAIYVYDKDAENVVLSADILNGGEYDYDSSLIMPLNSFSSTKFLSYSIKNGEVTIDEPKSEDGAAGILTSGEGQQIFAYMSKGKVKLFITIKED